MKEEDKRAVALNSLTSIGKEYVTLSDGTAIGEDVIKDLKKLMELELREKYKVNKTKWKMIIKSTHEIKAYDDITSKNDTLRNELTNKYKKNEQKLIELYKKKADKDGKQDTDEYKRLIAEIKDLENYFTIDIVPDMPISFNTIVKLESGSGDAEENFYCIPYIELNKDPKEIATILNDKKELDKIFREKKIKSFDDMVILDFYNEITKKLSDTKDYLRKTDPDIRQDIIDDLYNKLFALYDIKEYYLKDKVEDKEVIKEEYIKKKIRKNDNLSIGGGLIDNMKKTKKNLTALDESTTKYLVDATKKQEGDSIPERLGKSLVARPVVATLGIGVDTAKAVVNKAKAAARGLKYASPYPKEGMNYVLDKTPDIIGKSVDMYGKYKEKSKERDKANQYLEAEKFLLLLTGKLKDKDENTINEELNIDKLKEISLELGKESIYKKHIDDLISINNSLLSTNRIKLLKDQEDNVNKYIGDKEKTSGKFILEAVENYKKLKKSFVDKVNKDKNDIEEMLEQETGKEFTNKIDFDKIVESNNGTYIEKLKNMNSFLFLLDGKRSNPSKGGATPMYDVQKLKKIDDENETSGNTPFDYYRNLKDIYIDIVNQYYKLIDQIGEEENHYKFIYQYKSLGIEDDNAAKINPINPINPKDSESLKNLKEAYNLIYTKLKEAQNENDRNNMNTSIFVKDGDSGYPKTSVVMTKLLEDIREPEKKSLIEYKNTFESNGNWKKFTGTTSKPSLFDKLSTSIELIESRCTDVNSCPDILSFVKKIFNDTSTIGENEGKLNELNEKIQLIENRIKLLEEIILKIPKEFEKLYKVMKSMKRLSQATEYEEFVINILKRDKIEFFEKDKDKHPIIKALVNEKNEREDQLKKLKSQRDEAKKAIADEIAIKRAEKRTNQLLSHEGGQVGGQSGGNIDEKYKKDLKLDTTFLQEKYKTFNNLITNDTKSRDNNNLHWLMTNLKDDVEYLENNDNANQGSDKSLDIGRDRGIYEDIWTDYISAVDKKDNKAEPWKNYLLYLTEGEKVHERVIQNNLDPEIVLKLTFRDKSIYIFLMFLIRTINIITLEFFIEYNIIKSLQYTILLYGFMYLFIISLLVILVNYDSYKLRILFNYLNIHINSSNLLLQNVLFIIFIVLVYILVKSDDFLKYFGDIFDFTNIYNNIYEFNESLNEDSDINLTQNEKLKLLYRIDIISMIIFIFSAFLVLVL